LRLYVIFTKTRALKRLAGGRRIEGEELFTAILPIFLSLFSPHLKGLVNLPVIHNAEAWKSCC